MDWPLVLGLAVLALVGSFVSGGLGAGGGILLIPLALYVLAPLLGRRLDPHQVASLALVQGIAAALAGGVAQSRQGQVEAREVRLDAPLLAIAGFAGALLSAHLSGRALVVLFAAMTSAAALVMLVPPREATWPPDIRRRVIAAGLFAGVGVTGGIIGVGGGFLTVPVLIYVLGVPVRLAAGTGLVLSLVVAVPALGGKALTGQVPWAAAVAVALAALLGSVLGAGASSRLPASGLRGGLAIVIGLLALRAWADVLG